MADDNRGLLAEGAGLVWRRRSVLWWVFAVNLVLGAMGTLPAARQLNRALRHSLAGEQLFKGFDLGMFYELTRLPEVNLYRFTTGSYAFAALFAIFMLFVSGGILETYRQGRRRISAGDFFAASGDFFWRFVRLMVLSFVPFGLIGAAYFDVETAADYLGDKAVADQVGFVAWLAGVIVLFLLTLFVRLWFDLAKVHTVATNDRRMLRSAWKGLAVTRRQVRALLWIYLRVTLVAWLTLLLAFLIWTKIPPDRHLGDVCFARTGHAGAARSAVVANGERHALVSAARRASPRLARFRAAVAAGSARANTAIDAVP